MVAIKKFVLAAFFFFILPVQVFAESSKENIYAVELPEIIEFFDELEGSVNNLYDGKILLKGIIRSIESISNVKLDPEEICRYAVSALDEYEGPLKNKSDLIFILKSLLLTAERDSSDVNCLKCSNDKGNSSNDENTPTDLILGGVEILTGTLLQFVPGCKWIGRAVIADGIRRGFNGLGGLDKQNKEKNDFDNEESSLSIPKLNAFPKLKYI